MIGGNSNTLQSLIGGEFMNNQQSHFNPPMLNNPILEVTDCDLPGTITCTVIPCGKDDDQLQKMEDTCYELKLNRKPNEHSLKEIFLQNKQEWMKIFQPHLNGEAQPNFCIYRKSFDPEQDSSKSDQFLHILYMKSDKKDLSRNYNAQQLELFCHNRFYGPLVIAYNYNKVPYYLIDFTLNDMKHIQQINQNFQNKSIKDDFVPSILMNYPLFNQNLELLKQKLEPYAFFMFYYKTSWCPRKKDSHDSKSCIYAHHMRDFRRLPNMINYLPEDCPTLIQGIGWDKCPQGLMCNKCHTTVERLYHPDKYKRISCDRSRCNQFDICAFFHQQKEKMVAVREFKNFKRTYHQKLPGNFNKLTRQLNEFYITQHEEEAKNEQLAQKNSMLQNLQIERENSYNTQATNNCSTASESKQGLMSMNSNPGAVSQFNSTNPQNTQTQAQSNVFMQTPDNFHQNLLKNQLNDINREKYLTYKKQSSNPQLSNGSANSNQGNQLGPHHDLLKKDQKNDIDNYLRFDSGHKQMVNDESFNSGNSGQGQYTQNRPSHMQQQAQPGQMPVHSNNYSQQVNALGLQQQNLQLLKQMMQEIQNSQQQIQNQFSNNTTNALGQFQPPSFQPTQHMGPQLSTNTTQNTTPTLGTTQTSASGQPLNMSPQFDTQGNTQFQPNYLQNQIQIQNLQQQQQMLFDQQIRSINQQIAQLQQQDQVNKLQAQIQQQQQQLAQATNQVQNPGLNHLQMQKQNSQQMMQAFVPNNQIGFFYPIESRHQSPCQSPQQQQLLQLQQQTQYLQSQIQSQQSFQKIQQEQNYNKLLQQFQNQLHVNQAQSTKASVKTSKAHKLVSKNPLEVNEEGDFIRRQVSNEQQYEQTQLNNFLLNPDEFVNEDFARSKTVPQNQDNDQNEVNKIAFDPVFDKDILQNLKPDEPQNVIKINELERFDNDIKEIQRQLVEHQNQGEQQSPCLFDFLDEDIFSLPRKKSNTMREARPVKKAKANYGKKSWEVLEDMEEDDDFSPNRKATQLTEQHLVNNFLNGDSKLQFAQPKESRFSFKKGNRASVIGNSDSSPMKNTQKN